MKKTRFSVVLLFVFAVLISPLNAAARVETKSNAAPGQTTATTKSAAYERLDVALEATAALLEYRHTDGADQFGDEEGGNGKPYSPANFITPPFPGYVSGHSCVSAAAAKTPELFIGSDRFGETEKRKAGMMTESEYECKAIQMRLGQSPTDPKLTCDVALDLPTFSATAEMAGLSRVMGGCHIQADNAAGLELERKVSTNIFPKIKSCFDGTAGDTDNSKTTAQR